MWKEVYSLIKHGGFSYSDCMDMPVHERRFFINEMLEQNDERIKYEKQQMNQSKSSNSSVPNWSVPNAPSSK
ncbi:hypothetical protein COB55_04380 [Candidatus Wolfebacteria bacterium]|nr:MAG: hypothetical protein COB55_04380 [Candidatus Wolfebacteria bacterium]